MSENGSTEIQMVPLNEAKSKDQVANDDNAKHSSFERPPLVRYGAIVLMSVAALGLIIGFVLFAHTFFVPWVMVRFSTGGLAMWAGFGSSWFFSITGAWWLFPFFTAHHTRRGHLVGLVLASIFSLFGLLGCVGWAMVADHGAESISLLVLWLFPGVLAIAMHVMSLKTNASVTPEKSACGGSAKDRSPTAPKKCCKCDPRVTAVAFGMFLLFWCLLFSGATAVNGLISASEAAEFPPLGSVYTISLEPEMEGTVDMHIFCDGPAPSRHPSSPTIILAHGGGANSVAMTGLQQELINVYGLRACVYDRLGYGWTPSYYRRANFDDQDFPSDGTQLTRLLVAANEPGPFACGGHSGGAAVCLEFSRVNPDVVQALVGLDGFPDVVRGGQYIPGLFDPTGDPQASGILPFAFFASVPGLARGLLGTAGDDFEPAEFGTMMSALYSQERFWHSQYWDLLSDKSSGDSGFYFTNIPGAYQNQSTGYVYYANQLNVSTTWIVAHETVNKTCTETFSWDDNCCGDNRYDWCEQSEANAAFLAVQTDLYVNTIGFTPGKVFVGADFSGHGFVQTGTHIPWIAARMNESVRL